LVDRFYSKKNKFIPTALIDVEKSINKMKKVLFVATIISAFTVLTAFTSEYSDTTKSEKVTQSDYCDGWEEGYCEGWKDVKGPYAICPITPLCPMAEFGKSTYRDGYNRGFKAGSRAAM